MHFNRLLTCVVTIGSMLTLGSQANADFLTVTEWWLRSDAKQGGGGDTDLTNTTVVNPLNSSQTALAGGSTSTSDFDFAWNAVGGSFDIAVDQQRDGAIRSLAIERGFIRFTVADTDMDYDLSGFYSMTGLDQVEASVNLYNLDTGVRVFGWGHIDFGASNNSYTVGQTSGGAFLDGSPTGTLVPGNYSFTYIFAVFARNDDSGATAIGSLNMTLTGPTPEELTVNLVEDVIVLNLNNGINNALDSKLDAVMAALEDTNENNDQAACNALEAFINSTLAQSGNHIPEADADALIEAAQLIIDVLCDS